MQKLIYVVVLKQRIFKHKQCHVSVRKSRAICCVCNLWSELTDAKDWPTHCFFSCWMDEVSQAQVARRSILCSDRSS